MAHQHECPFAIRPNNPPQYFEFHEHVTIGHFASIVYALFNHRRGNQWDIFRLAQAEYPVIKDNCMLNSELVVHGRLTRDPDTMWFEDIFVYLSSLFEIGLTVRPIAQGPVSERFVTFDEMRTARPVHTDLLLQNLKQCGTKGTFLLRKAVVGFFVSACTEEVGKYCIQEFVRDDKRCTEMLKMYKDFLKYPNFHRNKYYYDFFKDK